MMEAAQTTDGFLRHAGRDFLIVLYTAFRSLKLYPVENAQVQKALDDLAATTKHLLDVEKELELRLQGEFLFERHPLAAGPRQLRVVLPHPRRAAAVRHRRGARRR